MKKFPGGIHINKNSIVGACTLVNRDIPEGATAVGIPCRLIHAEVTSEIKCVQHDRMEVLQSFSATDNCSS